MLRKAVSPLPFLARWHEQSPALGNGGLLGKEKGNYSNETEKKKTKQEGTLDPAHHASNQATEPVSEMLSARGLSYLHPLPAPGDCWLRGFLKGERPKHSESFPREEALTSQKLEVARAGRQKGCRGGPAGGAGFVVAVGHAGLQVAFHIRMQQRACVFTQPTNPPCPSTTPRSRAGAGSRGGDGLAPAPGPQPLVVQGGGLR